MDPTDDKIREIWGRKFKTVKNGLDESEVLSFVAGLIDQNNALASKLEHLDSLTKLAERTVIEANKQAQGIKKEAEEKANATAASIITEAEEKARTSAEQKIAAAEEQAKSILDSAREKAESIKASADDEAGKIIATANQNATSIEKHAESLKTEAENEANKIITQAQERGENLVTARTASAEKEAQNILEAAKTRAEEEAHLIKQRAERMLKRSQLLSESELKEKLKKAYQELLSGLIEETTTMPADIESRDSEPAKPEPVVHVRAERRKETAKQASISEKEPKESTDLYEGTIELVIPPPLSLDRMLQLHKHLRSIPNIEVLNLGVSADKSITIRVLLENPTPIRKILADFAEIETTAEAPQDADTIPTAKTRDKTPIKRIIVTTKS